MTNDNPTNTTAGGNPDAAETVLPKGKPTMSDEIVSHLKDELNNVIKESIKRKIKIDELEEKAKEYDANIAKLTKERDDAVTASQELETAYEEFTSKDHQAKEIQRLQRELLTRDVFGKIKSIEGVKLHDGVELSELLHASGTQDEFDKLQGDTPEDFTTRVVEAAKAKRPYLFVSPNAAVQPGESESAVRKEAPQQSALRAFGAQAAGGGSAPMSPRTDPAQLVDWRNPEAINRFVSSSG